MEHTLPTWAGIVVAAPCRLGFPNALAAAIRIAGNGPRAGLVPAAALLVALSPRVLAPGTVDLCC